jgi:hypothetical protein
LPSSDADVCTNCGRLVKEHLRLTNHDYKPVKRSLRWYLLHVFFGIIGESVNYSVLKEDDHKLAKHCLILGLILTLIRFYSWDSNDIGYDTYDMTVQNFKAFFIPSPSMILHSLINCLYCFRT